MNSVSTSTRPENCNCDPTSLWKGNTLSNYISIQSHWTHHTLHYFFFLFLINKNQLLYLTQTSNIIGPWKTKTIVLGHIDHISRSFRYMSLCIEDTAWSHASSLCSRVLCKLVGGGMFCWSLQESLVKQESVFTGVTYTELLHSSFIGYLADLLEFLVANK